MTSTTRETHSLSSIIGEFYGTGSAQESQAMSRQVLTQLFVYESRAEKRAAAGQNRALPLIKIEGSPLPLTLQQIVTSFFPLASALNDLRILAADAPSNDLFSLDDLCEQTEGSFLKNLRAAYLLQQQVFCLQPKQLHDKRLLHPYLTGSYPSAGCHLMTPKYALNLWSSVSKLTIAGLPVTDQEFEELLRQREDLPALSLMACPRLYTLEALSQLPHLTELTIALKQLRNEDRIDISPLGELHEKEQDLSRPAFDLSKLNLPNLTKLSIKWGPDLFIVDARKCPKLRNITVQFQSVWHNKNDPMLTRGLDIRGLKECTVTPYFEDEFEQAMMGKLKILRDTDEATVPVAAKFPKVVLDERSFCQPGLGLL